MICSHGFDRDVEAPVAGMHQCACCGLNGRYIYTMVGAEWPRTDPLCQDCRDAENLMDSSSTGQWQKCSDGSLIRTRKLGQVWKVAMEGERNMPISLFGWKTHRWLLSAVIVLIAPLLTVFYFSGAIFMAFTSVGILAGIITALFVRKWHDVN